MFRGICLQSTFVSEPQTNLSLKLYVRRATCLTYPGNVLRLPLIPCMNPSILAQKPRKGSVILDKHSLKERKSGFHDLVLTGGGFVLIFELCGNF